MCDIGWFAMSTCSGIANLQNTLTMLKHRKRFLLIAVFFVVVAGLFLSSRPRNEPKYEGRYVSDYLAAYAGNGKVPSRDEVAAAELAIRSIGTNGIPTYLGWLSQDPPPWKKRVFSKLPPLLAKNKLVAEWLVMKDERRQANACEAFWILGEDAAPAIPELCSLMRSRTNLSTQISFVMTGIGPVAIPALRSALADPQHPTREQIFSSIAMLSVREGSNECMPIITAALEDSNPVIRVLATNRFKWTGGENVFRNR
jgi:hypothetical protein